MSFSLANSEQQQGFTLIELIIVIVILGIIAVLAAPRFVGLQSDARIAVLEGLQGSMRSVSNLVYAKAIIQNIPNRGLLDTDAERAVQTNFGPVDTFWRYPESIAEQGDALGIVDLVQLEIDGNADLTVFPEDRSDTRCFAISVGYGVDDSTCAVTYKSACSATEPPIITVNETNC